MKAEGPIRHGNRDLQRFNRRIGEIMTEIMNFHAILLSTAVAAGDRELMGSFPVAALSGVDHGILRYSAA